MRKLNNHKLFSVSILFALWFLFTATAFSAVHFIENKGQLIDTDHKLRPDLLYKAQAGSVNIYFFANKISYVLRQVNTTDKNEEQAENKQAQFTPQHMSIFDDSRDATIALQRIDVEFTGANRNPVIQADEIADEKFNYYSVLFPQGVTNVRAFGKLTYKNIYPHIDIVFYGDEKNNLKYDFVIYPGGNPSLIKMKYTGADGLEVQDSQGESSQTKLKIQSSIGEMIEVIPKVYQNIEGKIVDVKAEYMLDETTLNFKLEPWNPMYSLVIDPYITYFGGRSGDEAFEIATDSKSNSIITGITGSDNFPVTSGVFQTISFCRGIYLGNQYCYDGFISKFDRDGKLIWSTYFYFTTLLAVDVDANDNIVVGGAYLGYQYPSTLPAVTSVFWYTGGIGSGGDAGIAKFDVNGQLIWNTAYGSEQGDNLLDLAVDNNNNVVIFGYTEGDSLPTSPGVFQQYCACHGNLDPGNTSSCQLTGEINRENFVAKLNPNGYHVWSSYLGGLGDEDFNGAVAVDKDNNIAVTGITKSSDFPTTPNGFQSADPNVSWTPYVVKLTPDGDSIWSSYINGTNAGGGGYGITFLNNGDIIATGATSASDFPVTAGAFQPAISSIIDVFIARFNSVGNLTYASYYGSGYASDIDADFCDNYFITGTTASSAFPFINAANASYYQTAVVSVDAFIAKFDADNARQYTGSFGGNNIDYSWGIAADKSGNVMITGTTVSDDLPVTPGAFQTSYAGTMILAPFLVGDAYLAQVSFIDASFTPSSQSGCMPLAINFNNTSQGGTSLNWDFGDGSTGSGNNVSHTFSSPGTYKVKFQTSSPCLWDTASIEIVVNPLPVINLSSGSSVCYGNTASISASGAVNYLWAPSGSLTSFSGTSVTAMPQATTTYTIIGTNANGCTNKGYVTIVVNKPNILISGSTSLCQGDTAFLTGYGAINYSWSPSYGLSSTTGAIVIATPTATTSYSITGVDANGCTDTTSVTVIINQTPVAYAGNDTIICKGTLLQLLATGGSTYSWNTGAQNASTIVNPTLTTSYTVTVSNGPCADTDEIIVMLFPEPSADAGNNVTIIMGNAIQLSSSGGGTYQWSPSDRLNCTDCQYPEANPLVTTTYYLTITDANGCTALDSVTVFVDTLCGEVFVPNAFSPNNDGENDVFKVYGNCIKTINLIIYNRWGEKVCETNDISIGWDGIQNGQLMKTDVFAYKLFYRTIKEEEFYKTGNVTLLR